jgi:hypothetical protein
VAGEDAGGFEGFDLTVGDLDAFGVGARVEFGVDGQSGAGGGRGDSIRWSPTSSGSTCSSTFDFRPGDRVSARLDLSNTGISLIADLGPDVTRVQLHLGATQVALGIPPVTRSPFRLRGRWHTHGQAHLWANGTLVAYRPDAVAGGSFSVIDLQLSGRSAGAGPATGTPRVRSTTVKVLRRDGPIGYLDELLPVRIGDGLTPECARRMAGKQQEAMRQIRAFMTASIARLTRAWSQGDAHEPFSPEAIRAQQAAVAAARAFVLLVSGRGDPSAAHLLGGRGR